MGAIEELKQSPLFALSLCSKELAHSNFWVWLLEIQDNNEHPFESVFLPKGSKFIKAAREEGNRDISIYYEDVNGNKKCHIIENKIKTLPTIKQLQGYQNTFHERNYTFAGGTLTGIVDTLDISELTNWSFKSYRQIAESIEEINNQHNLEYKAIINLYISDLKNIDLIIKEEAEKNKGFYVPSAEHLDSIKLADIFLKYQAELFRKNIKDRIEKEEHRLESKWGIPKVETSFNNKKSTITIIYLENRTNERGRIGIQLEGEQFRIYAGPSFRKSPWKDPEVLFGDLQKSGWFEKYNKKTIDGNETGMRGDYCKYATDTYTHVYQWYRINNQTQIDSLCSSIIDKLEKAKMLIDNGFSFQKD